MIRIAIATCCLVTLALGAAEEPAREALAFQGTIVKVDQGQGLVTVEGCWNGARGELAFTCPSTAITRKGKDSAGELKDLKPDMPVVVTFHRDLEAKVVYADAIVYEPAPRKSSRKGGGGCGGRSSGGGCPRSGGSRSSARQGGCPSTSGRSTTSRSSSKKSQKGSGGRRCPVTGKRY